MTKSTANYTFNYLTHGICNIIESIFVNQLTHSVCIKNLSMNKYTKNYHSEFLITWCLIFHFSNCETIKTNLHGIPNTVCLLIPLFNDKKDPNLT